MSDLVAEPLPPPQPHERHAQLETDLFCEQCGYNLHGQIVTRDPRLGFMVCRCPECGRFHPAGHRTTAASLWRSRLAAGLLLLWILIVLTAWFFATLGLGALRRARRLLVLALTGDKARAVLALIDGPEDPRWPCTALREHPQLDIVLTEQAAGAAP